MPKNEYNREILSLVMDDGVSLVLKEYVVSLVRAGYFDEEKVFELIGNDFKRNSQQRKVVKDALNSTFIDLKKQTTIRNLRELLNLDLISYDPKGHPIRCIKEIREAADWGLKQSKEFFDYIKPELIAIQKRNDIQ